MRAPPTRTVARTPAARRVRRARLPTRLLAAAFAAVAAAPVTAAGLGAAPEQVFETEKHRFRLSEVVGGLEHPWGVAFLPDGSMLISERPGRLRIVRDGTLDPAPVAGVPQVAAIGQGGLLDVALHPEFARNRLVYLSYAGPGDGGAGTEVARGRLVNGRLEDLETLLVVEPKSRGGRHFGSRLAFDRDGLLYITAGERGEPDRAQDPNDLAGSVLRLSADGEIPPDNPFVGRPDARPEIFSYGHRNPQGLARHPDSGAIWQHEHGPRGGDEVNIIRPGVNYGWPVITYGMSYAGFPIGEGTEKPGMAQPLTYWVPSIAPSGMAFYTGAAFPNWRGDLFVGSLRFELLVRLELEGETVVHEERMLQELGERIRDVRQGPDGMLYILTDSPDGALLRLEPVP